MRLKAAMFVVIYNFFSLYNVIATTSLSFYSLVICSYKTLITQTTLFNWSDILLLKIVDSRDSEIRAKKNVRLAVIEFQIIFPRLHQNTIEIFVVHKFFA